MYRNFYVHLENYRVEFFVSILQDTNFPLLNIKMCSPFSRRKKLTLELFKHMCFGDAAVILHERERTIISSLADVVSTRETFGIIFSSLSKIKSLKGRQQKKSSNLFWGTRWHCKVLCENADLWLFSLSPPSTSAADAAAPCTLKLMLWRRKSQDLSHSLARVSIQPLIKIDSFIYFILFSALRSAILKVEINVFFVVVIFFALFIQVAMNGKFLFNILCVRGGRK